MQRGAATKLFAGESSERTDLDGTLMYATTHVGSEDVVAIGNRDANEGMNGRKCFAKHKGLRDVGKARRRKVSDARLDMRRVSHPQLRIRSRCLDQGTACKAPVGRPKTPLKAGRMSSASMEVNGRAETVATTLRASPWSRPQAAPEFGSCEKD